MASKRGARNFVVQMPDGARTLRISQTRAISVAKRASKSTFCADGPVTVFRWTTNRTPVQRLFAQYRCGRKVS